MESLRTESESSDYEGYEVWIAARWGLAAELSNILERMNVSERKTALEYLESEQITEDIIGTFFRSTALIAAARHGNLDCIQLLLNYRADIEALGENVTAELDNWELDFNNCEETPVDNQNGTALFAAAAEESVDVVSCLVENGANVNTRSNKQWTPLMIASFKKNINVVRYLVQNGADLNLRDKEGNTALHYAILGLSPSYCDIYDNNNVEIVQVLLDLGASQLQNNRRLTPLLFACSEGMSEMVEYLIKRPECTKEEEIDALEFFGACGGCIQFFYLDLVFKYFKRGMEKRFEDVAHPVLKQVMEPIEAYQNRKESQTLQELLLIEGNKLAITMECLIIRERILGPGNKELLEPIESFAHRLCNGTVVSIRLDVVHRLDLSAQLFLRAIEISQESNQPIKDWLERFDYLFKVMVEKGLAPRENDIVELFEKIVCEYSLHKTQKYNELLWYSMFLVKFVSQEKLREMKNDSQFCVLLTKFLRLNPKDKYGNTLLHLMTSSCERFLPSYKFYGAVVELFGFPCLSSVKVILQLKACIINEENDKGDTPLHLAATYKPRPEHMHLLTDMLRVLYERGAHDDYVNKEGKTAMDMAETEEAWRFLSGISRLRLECIAARAVKKFGLTYLGEVSKIVQEIIERH